MQCRYFSILKVKKYASNRVKLHIHIKVSNLDISYLTPQIGEMGTGEMICSRKIPNLQKSWKQLQFTNETFLKKIIRSSLWLKYVFKWFYYSTLGYQINMQHVLLIFWKNPTCTALLHPARFINFRNFSSLHVFFTIDF